MNNEFLIIPESDVIIVHKVIEIAIYSNWIVKVDFQFEGFTKNYDAYSYKNLGWQKDF